MNSFSFSKPIKKVFPTSVIADGDTFPVNADFRNVLKLLKLLNDTEIIKSHKNSILISKFFKDNLHPKDPINEFLKFVMGDDFAECLDNTEVKEPSYDFEYDADAIYISFLKEYQIDLLVIEFLHWYKFKMLLMGLSSESAFKQRVYIRTKDLNGMKGKELSQWTELKESVALPVRLTAGEMKEQKEFKDTWGKVGF